VSIKTGQTFATPPGKHHTVKAGNRELVLEAIPCIGMKNKDSLKPIILFFGNSIGNLGN